MNNEKSWNRFCFVPLSTGKRIGDTIQCGYHGLGFDGTGSCVDAPHDDGDTISSMLWRHHYHVDAAARPFFGLTGDAEDVEGQGHARWDVPGVLFVDTAFWDHDQHRSHHEECF